MKQAFISEAKVLEEARKAVAEALQIDVNTVQTESSLIQDLGAESLDFLDINYRLEQAFGIKMARHTLLEHVEDLFGEESAIDGNGQLTEKAVQLLQLRFPGQDLGLQPGMDLEEVPHIITVRSMAQGVLDILESLPDACSACGKTAWKIDEAGTHIQCEACGEAAEFRNGDDLIQDWLNQVQAEKQLF